MELSDKNENEYLDEYVGKNVDVLFEERDGEYYKGHTANYIMVRYKTEENLENKIKKVKITRKEEFSLISE